MQLLTRCLPLLLLAACSPGPRTDQQLAERVTAQARALVQCYVTKDYQGIARWTLPSIVKGMGGAEAMSNRIEGGMKATLQITGGDLGTPAIHRRGQTIYAILPFTMKLQVLWLVPDKQDSWLLGVTSNDGEDWHFADGAGLTPATIERVLPGFPNDIDLPKVK